MIRRANELNLRLPGPEKRSTGDFTVMLTVQTMNYLHSGFHRVALNGLGSRLRAQGKAPSTALSRLDLDWHATLP